MGTKVLLVDDNAVLLVQMRARLEAEGYEVVVSPHPPTDAAMLGSCDVIIFDFYMPGIDTPKAIARARALLEASGRSCPIYLYTAHQHEAAAYRQHGCDGAFLRKGDADALVTQLGAALRLVELRKLRERGAR